MNIKDFTLFSSLEKKLAKFSPRNYLFKEYKNSENALEQASKKGDWKSWQEAMKKHHTFEYAIHYKNFLDNKGNIKKARKLERKRKMLARKKARQSRKRK